MSGLVVGEYSTEQRTLSAADLARIRRRSAQGIVRALVAQGLMLIIAVALSAIVGGMNAGVSALIGGFAYFLPNSLFALRLLVGVWGSAQAGPLTFFMGEAFKLGSAVLILGLAAWFGGAWLVWPALLFGLLCVLKGYVLLIAFRRLP